MTCFRSYWDRSFLLLYKYSLGFLEPLRKALRRSLIHLKTKQGQQHGVVNGFRRKQCFDQTGLEGIQTYILSCDNKTLGQSIPTGLCCYTVPNNIGLRVVTLDYRNKQKGSGIPLWGYPIYLLLGGMVTCIKLQRWIITRYCVLNLTGW